MQPRYDNQQADVKTYQRENQGFYIANEVLTTLWFIGKLKQTIKDTITQEIKDS